MLLLGCLLPLAHAATVTEIPPFLRGDVTLGYEYDRLAGSLEERGGEEDVDVGQRTVDDHRTSYGFSFGAGPGVAVFATLPHYVRSAVTYDELGTMVYDPETGSGTYEGTNPGSPGTRVEGSGLGGLWFGVRGTPFSETFTSRKNRATWLLEGAVRTADKTNLWTVADAKRGAGPGSVAFRLHSAFSTTFKSSQPYLSGTWVSEGTRVTDTSDDNEDKVLSDAEVQPASTFVVRTGVEVLAAENKASGSRMSFDIHTTLAYTTWSEVPSGIFLPEVLDTSEGHLVQQAEALEPGAGIALYWRPMTFLQVDLYGDAAWHLPQRIESPYPVYTGEDTLRVTAGGRMTVRVR